MTKKEKEEMKKFVKRALANCLGLTVSLEKIELLESSFNGVEFDYVMFRIKCFPHIEYQAKYDYCHGFKLRIIHNDDWKNSMTVWGVET